MNQYDIIRLVYKLVISLSALGAFFYWNKWKGSFWKWLPFYLLFIALAEWGGYLIRINEWGKWNPAYYSFIVHPGIFIFLYWLFGQYDRQQGRRNRLTRPFMALLALACLADFQFFHPRGKEFWFHSFSYLAGVVLLLVLLIRFYHFFIFSQRILGFKKDTMFWVSTALLVYYLGTFPFFGLRNSLQAYDDVFLVYWYLQMALATLLYLSFFIIYKWTRPK